MITDAGISHLAKTKLPSLKLLNFCIIIFYEVKNRLKSDCVKYLSKGGWPELRHVNLGNDKNIFSLKFF